MRSVRASDAVYRALRDEIVLWHLAPGAVLGEVEQAGRLGVSRTPVREALRRLAAEGLVTSRGRTLVVSDLASADVAHLFELREALETQAARLAARRRAPGVFDRLAERFAAAPDLLDPDRHGSPGVPAAADPDGEARSAPAADPTGGVRAPHPTGGAVVGEARADPDRRAYYALVEDLDRAVDEAARSPHLTRALAALRPHVARARRLSHDNPRRLAQAAAEHRLIASAIADGDEALAVHATAVHLHASLVTVVTALEGGRTALTAEAPGAPGPTTTAVPEGAAS